MPSILSELLPASFRGAPFLMPSHQQEGLGRKTVRHEFPFSNSRDIEDLGRSPRIFTINGLIENSDGEYFSKRFALEEALSQPGPGLLVHPFSGIFLVSLLHPPTITESDDALSVANFKMVFGETLSGAFPNASGNLPSKINSLGNSIRDAVGNSF